MPEKNGKSQSGNFDDLRTRAQRILKSSGAREVPLGGECEARLREELGIHNVELEIQNEELRQARIRLENSQRYLSDLFQHSPIGYVVLTPSGIVQDLNDAAADVLLLSKERLRGQRLQAFVPHTDLFSYSRCLKNLMETDHRQTCEVRLRTRHDHRLHTRIDMLRLKVDDHPYEHVILCAIQDITSEKEAERVLAERNLELEEIIRLRTEELLAANQSLRQENTLRTAAQQQAEQADRAKSHFLAQMSHEIRTPLNGVLGMLQLLESSSLDQSQCRLVAAALQSGSTLLRLIGDLLDLSRIEAGTLAIIPQPFSPREALETLVAVALPSARDRGLALTLEIDPALPHALLGDRLRFEQIASNLLNNALKFTPSGAVQVRLSVVRRDEERQELKAHLMVTDTGVGIAPLRIAGVFDPFVHFDAGHAASREGAGLGLAIVKHLAEQMGGSVHIESSPGNGTKVHCSLTFGMAPASHREDAAGTPEVDEPDAGPDMDIIRGLRVLLVEDNAVNELFAVSLLEESGCTVTVARNGREALDRLRLDPADIVLMDVEMPEMNGLEATKAIRGDASGKLPRGIPIIALTAYARAEDRQQLLAAGFSDYVSKPFEIRTVLRLLAKLAPHK